MEDNKRGFFGRIKDFGFEVMLETKKVTWPSRDSLVGVTWVLIFVGVLLTLTLAVIDWVFGGVLTKLLTGGRG